MNKGVFLFWGILIAVASARLAWSFTIAAPDIGSCLKHAVLGSGTIDEDPDIKGGSQIIIVAVKEIAPKNDQSAPDVAADSSTCPSGILIRLKTKLYPRFAYGDDISFAGNLSKPFNFEDSDGRTFDYQGYLAKDNVFYEIKSAQVASPHPLEENSDPSR